MHIVLCPIRCRRHALLIVHTHTHTHIQRTVFLPLCLVLSLSHSPFSLLFVLARTHTHTHKDMLVTATTIRSLLVYFLVLFSSSNERTNYPFSSDRSLSPPPPPIDESSHFKAERQDTKVIISFLSLFSLLRLIIGHKCAVFLCLEHVWQLVSR